MNILELTGVVFGGALLAGLIGSLTGLGGGTIITPPLTLVLGVDIHYAIGAALVSVIATSCGAASAYVKEGLLKYPAWHVYGGGDHHRCSDRGVAGVAGLHCRHRGTFWGCSPLFGRGFTLAAREIGGGRECRSCCDKPRVGFQLSNRDWNRQLPRPPHSPGEPARCSALECYLVSWESDRAHSK